MTDTTIAPAPIGHNRRMVPQLTKADLIEDHGQLFVRRDALAKDFTTLPQPVNTEADLAKVHAWGKAANTLLEDLEKTRVQVNEPYILTTGAINGLFNADSRDVIKPLKDKAERLGGAYQAKVAEELRKQREEAARVAREEEEARLAAAVALEEQGNHLAADVSLRAAEAAAEDAQRAAIQAQAPAVEMSRVQTDLGTVGTRRNLGFDYDRATLDLEALRAFLDDEAIRKAIAGYVKVNGKPPQFVSGERKLRGVTFREEVKSSFGR